MTVDILRKILGCIVLDRAGLVGSNLCQGKNDHKSKYFLKFVVSSQKNYVLTKDKYGNNQQHMTFKGFNDSKRLLHRSQYFKVLEDEKVTVMLPKS